ncbi:unnamed protein product [Tenebrio molitor]|nr:unnamed protein product [Tenebrio molitor]
MVRLNGKRRGVYLDGLTQIRRETRDNPASLTHFRLGRPSFRATFSEITWAK